MKFPFLKSSHKVLLDMVLLYFTCGISFPKLQEENLILQNFL